jgi:hypothetical protein
MDRQRGFPKGFPAFELRVLVFSALVLASLIAGTGQALQQAAFFVVLVSCATRVLASERLPIFAAWELGVATVVLGDSVFSVFTYGDISGETVDGARRFLVLAVSAVEIAYELSSRALESRRRRQPVQTHRDAVDEPNSLQGSRRALLGLLLMSTYVIWRLAPGAISEATSGRIGLAQAGSADAAPRGVLEAIVGPIDRGAAMVLPALWVIWFGARHRWRAAAAASPILALLLIGTTRYYVLVAVSGLLLSGHRSKGRALSYASVAAVVLGAASWVITTNRGNGILAVSPSSRVNQSDFSLLGGEGVLRTVAQIMVYQDRSGLEYGSSILSVAIFWIPRALWPSKPTLLGYWFPREYGLDGFSSGYSVAASFAGDPLVDFGFIGGGLVVAGLGLGFAYLDMRVVPKANPSGTWAAVIGCAYGLAFFAARSADTALIAGLGIIVAAAIYGKLSLREPLRANSEAFRSPASSRTRS